MKIIQNLLFFVVVIINITMYFVFKQKKLVNAFSHLSSFDFSPSVLQQPPNPFHLPPPNILAPPPPMSHHPSRPTLPPFPGPPPPPGTNGPPPLPWTVGLNLIYLKKVSILCYIATTTITFISIRTTSTSNADSTNATTTCSCN
jgi:hypothetical protein